MKFECEQDANKALKNFKVSIKKTVEMAKAEKEKAIKKLDDIEDENKLLKLTLNDRDQDLHAAAEQVRVLNARLQAVAPQ